MAEFEFNPERRDREFFFDTSSNDRFKKADKPTETRFKELFDSQAFILDRDDRAKVYSNNPTDQNDKGLQGLVVKNTCEQVKDRTNPADVDTDGDPYSYAVDAENLPELQTYNDTNSYVDGEDVILVNPIAPGDDAMGPPVDDPTREYWKFGESADPVLNNLNINNTTHVEEDNETLECRTIWKVQTSTRFLNWIILGFKWIKDYVADQFKNIIEPTLNRKATESNWVRDGINDAIATAESANTPIELRAITESGVQINFSPFQNAGTGEYFTTKWKRVGDKVTMEYEFFIKDSLKNDIRKFVEFRINLPYEPSLFAPNYGKDAHPCVISGRRYDIDPNVYHATEITAMVGVAKCHWNDSSDYFLRINKPSGYKVFGGTVTDAYWDFCKLHTEDGLHPDFLKLDGFYLSEINPTPPNLPFAIYGIRVVGQFSYEIVKPFSDSITIPT